MTCHSVIVYSFTFLTFVLLGVKKLITDIVSANKDPTHKHTTQETESLYFQS